MIVILDSNSWLEDVHLRSNKFASLVAFLKRTKSSLVIPEIVLEEVLAVYRRRLEQAIVSAEQALDELKGLAVSSATAGLFQAISPKIDLEHEVRFIKQKLLSPFPSLRTQLHDVSRVDLREVYRRGIAR